MQSDHVGHPYPLRRRLLAADTIAGAIFVALAVVVYSVNWQESFAPTLGDPGSTLLPSVIAVLMGAMGLVLVVQSLLAAREQPPAELEPNISTAKPGAGAKRSRWWTGALTGTALVAYVVALHLLGYIFSTVLFFFVAATLLGDTRPRALLIYFAIAIAVALTTFYLLAFGLNISLPQASLIEYFNV